MKIGIQQLQIGSKLTTHSNALNTLNTLKEKGFNGIELNGFMIRKNPFIVKLLTSLSGMSIKKSDKFNWLELIDKSNLKVISIHEDINTLETKLDMVVEECKKFKTNYVVLTGNYKFDYTNETNVVNLANRLNNIGKSLKEYNINFLYHNHNVEFVRVNSKELAYEILINNTNSQYVNFEFDSYWASVSGVDAISYMEKLGSRIKLHHICDNGNLKIRESITPIIKMKSCELGKGCLNLEKMIELDIKNNIDYVILEQHKNHIDNNPLKSAIISIEYLNNIINK